MRSAAHALGMFLGKQAKVKTCPDGYEKVDDECRRHRSNRWFGGIFRDAQRDMMNGNNGNGNDGGNGGSGGNGGI